MAKGRRVGTRDPPRRRLAPTNQLCCLEVGVSVRPPLEDEAPVDAPPDGLEAEDDPVLKLSWAGFWLGRLPKC